MILSMKLYTCDELRRARDIDRLYLANGGDTTAKEPPFIESLAIYGSRWRAVLWVSEMKLPPVKYLVGLYVSSA